MMLLYLYFFVVFGIARSEFNILIIGSTESYSSMNRDALQAIPFNPLEIANHLREITQADSRITGPKDVVFEDLYRTKFIPTSIGQGGALWDLTYRSYSLAQYYYWPEDRTARLKNLIGEGGIAWDYVVLMDDPYLIANMPGIYAEGVNNIAQQIDSNKLILLMQWPKPGSSSKANPFDASHYREITYRVGNSLGIKVVPAGDAWTTLEPKDVSSQHPSPNGAYLAAACIYSAIFSRDASQTGYTFQNATFDDLIATHAMETVQNSKSQYTGKFKFETPFTMKAVKKRAITASQSGSSSEAGINGGLGRVLKLCKVTYTVKKNGDPSLLPPSDFNFGRANRAFETNKRYQVDPTRFGRAYGFPMQDQKTTSAETMLYGIDARYNDDGTDLGIAFKMIRQNETVKDVRTVPLRLMWAKIHDFDPLLEPLRDNWHMSRYADEMGASYMYTLLSERCCIGDEPQDNTTDSWRYWLSRRIGYETAWRLSSLQARASGFVVLPSSEDAEISTSIKTKATLMVRFLYAPISKVTVTVSINNPNVAIINPHTLTFTADNYATAQTVTVLGLPGNLASEEFDVIFSTSSDDEVFDELNDVWNYTNARTLTGAKTIVEKGEKILRCQLDSTLVINLGINGATSQNTFIIGTFNGSISWNGANLNYTASLGYSGTESFSYYVEQDATVTKGHIIILVGQPYQPGANSALVNTPRKIQQLCSIFYFIFIFCWVR